MSLLDGNELEALIHAYARARWSGNADAQTAEDLGACLGRDLRDRIDVLGIDAERLLTVDPADALTKLEALEKEAMLEDANAKSMAAKVRAREEVRIHDQAKAPSRDHRVRSGKYRQPAGPTGHRRRRQPS